MTRQKKSRKIGQIGVRKLDARPENTKDKRIKKVRKGQKSGSRNSLIEENKVTTSTNSSSKKVDTKVGSKKPISLIVEEKAPLVEPQQPQQPQVQPSVKLKKVDNTQISPEKELEQIEGDERLVELVERVEGGELLKGKDAKYFNAKMARHAELLEILGIDDSEEEENEELDQLSGNFDADQWDDLLNEE